MTLKWKCESYRVTGLKKSLLPFNSCVGSQKTSGDHLAITLYADCTFGFLEIALACEMSDSEGKTWGDEARSYVNEIDTYNLLDAICKVAVSMGYHQAILKVNQAIIEKLSHHGRGISTSTFPQAGDYNKIRITPDKYPAAPIDTPRHHQQQEEDEDSSLSELDDEDFRGFEITSTPGPAESATKKRNLASGIAAEDDKQERDCHCSDDSPAAWKKDVMKAKKYTIAKDINSLMTWYPIWWPRGPFFCPGLTA
jgi:hypothetical protein